MSTGPAAPLVLIHKRTKQRYPLQTRDFVIGRAQGDLVFDQDPKLSSKHCLIRLTPQGFAVHDLKSRTGVQINGVALPAGKACLLRPGTEFSVGDQEFTVEADKPSQSSSRRRRAASRKADAYLFTVLAALVVGGTGAFLIQSGRARSVQGSFSQPGLPSLASMDEEMREAMQKMNSFSEGVRNHQLTEEQSLAQLKEELIPRFSAVHTQLQAFRTKDSGLARRVDLQRRQAGAYLGQVSAMAKFIQTKDQRYTVELAEYNRQLQVISEQMHEEARRPTSRLVLDK